MQKALEEETRWDWIPASQMIQTQFNGEIQFLDLAPQIIVTHPDGDVQFKNLPLMKLYIDTEKSLQYTEDHGWNWHKSWNLPNITVRLEVKDSQTGDLLLPPKNIFAQLFAVKAVLENPQSFYLVDVGLRGTSKQELQDGQAFFSALRFASTSYNNEGVKFHLLLCVYIQASENELPKVLNTTISPPIFVDSRKTAKQANVRERTGLQFADPFPLECLEKEFIKRENKRKSDHDIKIDNDVDGLLNYLTAPNIRHKVKHPFFLALKFSNCFRIYYNRGVLQKLSVKNKIIRNEKSFQMIEKMQTTLHKDPATRNAHSSSEERQFIIICDECDEAIKTKKLQESIDYLNVASISVIKNMDHIPPFFEKIDATDLLTAYKENYENIVVLTKQLKLRYSKDEYDSDSEGSSDSSVSDRYIQKRVRVNPEAEQKPKIPEKQEIQKPDTPAQEQQNQMQAYQLQLMHHTQRLQQQQMQASQNKDQGQVQQLTNPELVPNPASLINQSKGQVPVQIGLQGTFLDQSRLGGVDLNGFPTIPNQQNAQQTQIRMPTNIQLNSQMNAGMGMGAGNGMNIQMSQIQQQPQLLQQLPYYQQMQQAQLQNPQLNQLLWQQQLMLQQELQQYMNPLMMYQMMNPAMMMQNQRMMAQNPMLQQQLLQQHLLRQQMMFAQQGGQPQQKPNIKDENQ